MHFDREPSEHRLVTNLVYDEARLVTAAFLEHVNWPESEYTTADKDIAKTSPSSQVRIDAVDPEVIEEILLDFEARTPDAVAYIKATSRTPRHLNKEAIDREDMGDLARDLARLLREKLNEFLEKEEESVDKQAAREEVRKNTTAESLSALIDLETVYEGPRKILDDEGPRSNTDDANTPN